MARPDASRSMKKASTGDTDHSSTMPTRLCRASRTCTTVSYCESCRQKLTNQGQMRGQLSMLGSNLSSQPYFCERET